MFSSQTVTYMLHIKRSVSDFRNMFIQLITLYFFPKVFFLEIPSDLAVGIFPSIVDGQFLEYETLVSTPAKASLRLL